MTDKLPTQLHDGGAAPNGPSRRRIIPGGDWPWLLLAVAIYIVQATIGIDWGLPTRQEDAFLFGGQPAWSGDRIHELTGDAARNDAGTGADVDLDPLDPDAGIIWLNETESDQAEIYRRYRLFTHQPDEMITLMAISGMNPKRFQFDPRLYQYGGMFIYPSAAVLAAGDVTGALHVTTDPAWYLDHPADFGAFYVGVRSYAAAWGVLGIFVVYGIARRLAGGTAGVAAAMLFPLLPIVVCMSHEAKPHLPGAVLMLMAVWFAIRWVQNARVRDFYFSAAACGAACGMVLSSAPILILCPLAALWHTSSTAPDERVSAGKWRARKTIIRTGLGALLAIGVYAITNPYVPINLVRNREVLASNFGNSVAMYEVHRIADGAARVADLTVEGASLPIAVVGCLAAIMVLVRRRRETLPLLIPAAVFATQFILLGAGKPDEFGRFGVFTDVALLIAAAGVLGRLLDRQAAQGVAGYLAVAAFALYGSAGYLWNFHADATGQGSRTLAAQRVAESRAMARVRRETPIILVRREPAPYACPPLDFTFNRVVLVRTESELESLLTGATAPPIIGTVSGLIVDADSTETVTAMARELGLAAELLNPRPWFLPSGRISWANKPMVWVAAADGE